MVENQIQFQVTGPIPLTGTDELTQAKIIRLCVFMNVLQTLYRHLFSLQNDEPVDEFDKWIRASHELVSTILLVGVLKEGADAIRDALPALSGAVAALNGTLHNEAQIKEAYDRIKVAVDNSKGSQSLLSKVLVTVRDDAAFHWRRNEIQRLCEQEAGKFAPYAIVRNSEDPLSAVRMPLADELLGRIAFGVISDEDRNTRIQQIHGFGNDVVLALGTLVPIVFQQRGCKAEPLGRIAPA